MQKVFNPNTKHQKVKKPTAVILKLTKFIDMIATKGD